MASHTLRCRCGITGLLGAAVLAGWANRPTTFPVKGVLVYDKGDIRLLSGSTIVCQHQEDPSIQSSGEIHEDGSFELQTNWKGRVLPGAIAGPYRAWIALSTEGGSEETQLHRVGVDPRYLGETSDLAICVPPTDEVVLTIMRAAPGAERLTEEQPTLGIECTDN